jgi:predicted P-loop ATPase
MTENEFIKKDFFLSEYAPIETPLADIEKISDDLKGKDSAVWKEIYTFAHGMNKAGRHYAEADVENICELYCEKIELSKDKVEAVFRKVFDNNKAEFDLDNKPDIYKVELWLKQQYDFAGNEVLQTAECKPKGSDAELERLNIDSIYRKMQHSGFKFSMEKLKSLLRSDFLPKYNPFKDYFENLEPWDYEHDHIGELARYVSVDDSEFYVNQFRKCLARCVGCSLYGKENRIVFVFVGETQNTGKSTFLRFLNPFGNKYYTEAPMHNNKDSSFAMAENFIYNLEELASLSNIDVNRLKSIISMASIKERKAYAVDVIEQPRRANFFASTNKGEFLTDTENTRWLCFNVTGIEWGYKKEVDIDKVWAQAYALYHDPDFNDQLTKEESNFRDAKNKDYEINDYEKELIKRNFAICMASEGEFYSNADILKVLEVDAAKKLEPRFIGKNMVQIGFVRAVRKQNGHTVRGYMAKKIFGNYQIESPENDKPF